MNKINNLLVFAAAVCCAAPALAQTWPTRTVRIIVPYTAGGNTDFTARTVGAKLAEMWGQQVIIDNRPGGGTNIGSELGAKALPDGYTLFMGGAYLDVFAKEPLAESPLWDLPNVLITPHNSAAATGNDERVYQMFIANLEMWHQGKALRNTVRA